MAGTLPSLVLNDLDDLINDGLLAVTEGCRLPVKMRGSEDWPKAEVISIRTLPDQTTQYYVHFVDYNKRLDDWVTEDRLDTRRIEPPTSKDSGGGGSSSLMGPAGINTPKKSVPPSILSSRPSSPVDNG